jgi:hypothetical protein
MNRNKSNSSQAHNDLGPFGGLFDAPIQGDFQGGRRGREAREAAAEDARRQYSGAGFIFLSNSGRAHF